MYVYMVRSEYLNGCVYNEAIFDSVDKAVQFINEWDLDTEYDGGVLVISLDETRGEGLGTVRTINYSAWEPDESVDLFIDKYEVNSIICD